MDGNPASSHPVLRWNSFCPCSLMEGGIILHLVKKIQANKSGHLDYNRCREMPGTPGLHFFPGALQRFCITETVYKNIEPSVTLTSPEPLSFLCFFLVYQGVKTIHIRLMEELMARRSRRRPPPSRFLLWQRDDDLQGLS